MTEQEIKAEHDRLRPIVFEGMSKSLKFSGMDKDGLWVAFSNHPLKSVIDIGTWHGSITQTTPICNNQPTTTLHWTDTLIQRGVR